MQLETRNAEVTDLVQMLKEQHARKLDMVVPASKLSSENAVLRVEGAEPIIEDDGVTSADGYYRPTVVCDEGLAAKLEIPVGYLKRLRSDRPDIFDANVNGWLNGHATTPGVQSDNPYKPDPRSFLLRTFKAESSEREGVARALLSQNYRIVDNLDVLLAALQGVRDAGADVQIDGCDLTERRMYVRIVSPSITALAPTLLKGYRSPFTGDGRLPHAHGRQLGAPGHEYTEDVVFGGFEISNSETGGGAFTITPRLVVLVCRNGLTITRDALRSIHLGGKLDEGAVRWSEDTQRKSLELVTAQARDAVSTFLDTEYMTMVLERIEQESGREIGKPETAIKTIGKTLRYTEAQIDGVLDHFIRGGQVTAGGVLQAVTSFAQTIGDADEAHEFEASAMRAFDLAVATH